MTEEMRDQLRVIRHDLMRVIGMATSGNLLDAHTSNPAEEIIVARDTMSLITEDLRGMYYRLLTLSRETT
jgi:hypothetical protein